jgi:hypothetical protein
MRQLRLVGVADDGGSLLLETPTGDAFRLPLDERVRAACRGDLTRLGQIEIEMDNPLRPREIQARVRAGESAEQVAASAGMSLDRVLRFAYPVLRERERVVAQARATRLHAKRPETLAELVEERLVGRGTDAATLRWDAWRREDGQWTVRLSWRHAAEHAATWVFQLARRMLRPDDPAAEQLSAEEFHARTITAVTPLAVAARVPGWPGGAAAHPAGTGAARPGDRPARGVEARAGRGGASEPSPPTRRPGTHAPAAGTHAPAAGTPAPAAGKDAPGAAGRGRTGTAGRADRPGAAGGSQPAAFAADRTGTAAGGGQPSGAAGGARPGPADPSFPARAGGAGRAGRTGGRTVSGAGPAGTHDTAPAPAGGSMEAAAGGGGPARTAAGDGERTAAGDGRAADAPSGGRPGRRPPRADGGSEDSAAQPRRIATGGESDPRAGTDEDRARRPSVPSWDDILLGVRRRH